MLVTLFTVAVGTRGLEAGVGVLTTVGGGDDMIDGVFPATAHVADVVVTL
jgi:hypothetical protein